LILVKVGHNVTGKYSFVIEATASLLSIITSWVSLLSFPLIL
jgi:hypothetical protein